MIRLITLLICLHSIYHPGITPVVNIVDLFTFNLSSRHYSFDNIVICLHATYRLGMTPFDNIVDQDEWIQSGFFDEEINARLKGNINSLIY